MNLGSSGWKPILIFVPIALIMGVIGYWVIGQAQKSVSELPVLGELPEFEFVASDGSSFGRADMIGRLNVVDFFFTRCLGPCPIMSANMADLYNKMDGNDKIRFISISVDPEFDSLSVLKEYGSEFGVTDRRWVFLRGEQEAVKRLSEEGFMLAAESLPVGHSTRFVLVDEKARIRGYYSGTDKASLDILITHLRQLAGADR